MAGDGAKGFKFEPGGIGGIFKANKLKVPTFQREYSWEKEQVEQLLTDFNRAKSDHTDHFLGTIVTINKGSSEPLEIVDGQQRLTTTALLITAIRETMKEIGQNLDVVESINHDYLSSFDRKIGGQIPKLTLNIDDNNFFSAIVRGEQISPTRESHKRLDEAYRLTKKFIGGISKGFSAADRASALNDWLDFIELEASVILVKTDDAAKAFKMFETLNDRGLKTSQADLVKSYLFGESGGRIAEAQARWSSMKDNLEEIADDDRAINYLRHVLIASKQFVRGEEIYSTIQTSVRGESNAASFLSSLESTSRTYTATFQPSSPFWQGYSQSTTRALSIVNKFDLKPMRPLILALALRFDPKKLEAAMQLLASISVRLVIASRTRSGTLEQTFATTALSVFDETIKDIKGLKNGLKAVIVTDADFKDEFASARVSNASLGRYYLSAIEAARKGEAEPWYVVNDDPTMITLEHVIPQNATVGWEHIDEEQRKLYTKRIGNLCLMQKTGNENIGNKPFSEKREALSTSPYYLTSMIGEKATWGPSDVEERQSELADEAVKTWPV